MADVTTQPTINAHLLEYGLNNQGLLSNHHPGSPVEYIEQLPNFKKKEI